VDKERLDLIKTVIELITACITLITAIILGKPIKKPHNRNKPRKRKRK
jgi:hypothetical protein